MLSLRHTYQAQLLIFDFILPELFDNYIKFFISVSVLMKRTREPIDNSLKLIEF